MPRLSLASALATAAFLGAAPTAAAVTLPTPTISGTPQQGQTLTCLTGTLPAGATLAGYAWKEASSTVGSSSTYLLTAADVGKTLTCTVSATLPAVPPSPPVTLTATSLPTLPVSPLSLPGVPVNTTPPSISGTGTPGSSLSCLPGSWTNSPSGYSYLWDLNGTSISGANASSYVPTSAEAGQALTCVVAATNGAGPSLPAVSLPVTVPSLPGGSAGSGSGAGSSSSSSSSSSSGGSSGSGSTSVGAGGGSGASAVKPPVGAVHPNLLALTFAPARLARTAGALKRVKFELRYKVDRAAKVLIVIQRVRGGKTVTLGTVTVVSSRAGTSTVRLSRQLAKRLSQGGHFKAVAGAEDTAGWSAPRTASLTVAVRRAHKRHH